MARVLLLLNPVMVRSKVHMPSWQPACITLASCVSGSARPVLRATVQTARISRGTRS
jgi:hypothetical protein